MKKTINTLWIMLAIAGLCTSFSGCSSYLDSETPSVVTDEFYNTKEGQEKLIVDLYSKFRSVYNTGELQYYGTDLYMAITETQSERMFNGYDATFNSTAPVVGSYWNNLYKIVQESNILLTRCTEDIAGNDYAAMNARGHFFRALAYYYLVETFGPVPFYTIEQSEVLYEVARTPEQEIYDFLIQDLEAVLGTLSFGKSVAGEVNDAAVTFLLGKLYLTRAYKPYGGSADFTRAAALFDLINNSAEYQLLDSYAASYDENNQNNSEVIWAIQYGTDRNFQGSGNPQQALFGFNIVAVEPNLFVYNQSDYSSMSRGYWVIPSAHEYFTNSSLDTRYDVTFKREFTVNNTASGNYGTLGIYFPRWDDNSGDTQGALRYYPFKTSTGEYNWYPQSTALAVLASAIDRMPIVNKFKDTKMDWGLAGTREDVAFRLGDAYLLGAEAYLGAGQVSNALARVNTLRRRAAADEEAYDNYLKASTVDLDFILDERARELFGEHDRWFDLKRTGKLIERAAAKNIFVQKYDNLKAMHLVRPIPQDEINKTNGLEQNEGY
ncbi:RagB/SusD family nutrient uptake outer membrane protein [Olivibacter sitiensis]|uniref:RagB/SusD family nutrient uptake outer membrane protein n=1 Tax=Olivibacter sitiensis TaxID=376470 RepID=UPI0004075E82|nr:RagB/SusD family nutrient uptake outer membrane protein [Olivibacter sitiensis]